MSNSNWNKKYSKNTEVSKRKEKLVTLQKSLQIREAATRRCSTEFSWSGKFVKIPRKTSVVVLFF